MTRDDLVKLCQEILANNELLVNARQQAGNLVHPTLAGTDKKKYSNCCAATLSYLLIDGLGLDLQPTAQALKLAYILEQEIGLNRVPLPGALLAGDIGVVNQPPNMAPQRSDPDDNWIPDGDANVDVLMPMGMGHHQYAGDGYQNTEDPEWKNIHHIYLIIAPSPVPADPNMVTVADNQLSTPHSRNIMGAGKWSRTNRFLRAI